MLKALNIILFITIMVAAATAQRLQFAGANRYGDGKYQLVYQLSEASGPGTFTAPEINGAKNIKVGEAQKLGESSSMVYQNGKLVENNHGGTYRYVITFEAKKDVLKVSPAVVVVDDKKFSTESLTIDLSTGSITKSGSATAQTERNIALVVETSKTMLANDVRPTRLKAMKKALKNFVNDHATDKFSLVSFDTESNSILELTNKQVDMTDQIGDLSVSKRSATEGAAIGDGAAAAIEQLKAGKSKSKAIILFADCSNSTGEWSTLAAAKVAKDNGIRICAVGLNVDDAEPLKKMAEFTGGKYFDAKTQTDLNTVLSVIDEAIDTKVDKPAQPKQQPQKKRPTKKSAGLTDI